MEMEGSLSEFRDWAHLPPGVVELISGKVKSITDLVRFRAVCPPWRSASLPKPRHLPPQLPWLMLPWDARDKMGDIIDDGMRLFYDLWESKMRKLHLPETSGMVCCASYRGWLLLVATDEGEETFLLNPLTRARIQLPPFASPVKHLGALWDHPRYDNLRFDQYFGMLAVEKMIFSADLTDPNCLITVFPKRCRGFFCCRVNDPIWTRVYCRPTSFTDATYYNGRFYVLYEGDIMIIDSNKPEERSVYDLEPELAAVCKYVLEGKSGVYVVVPVHDTSNFVLDEDDPAAHDAKKCPKQKIELYQFQEQLLKLKKVTDTRKTIIFCLSDVWPYLAVCSGDTNSLDGGSMYMVRRSWYADGRQTCYGIETANLDDGKLKLVVSEVGKEPHFRPSAWPMWFQPSFF